MKKHHVFRRTFCVLTCLIKIDFVKLTANIKPSINAQWEFFGSHFSLRDLVLL